MSLKKIIQGLTLGSALYLGACGGASTNPEEDQGIKPDIVQTDSGSDAGVDSTVIDPYKIPDFDNDTIVPKPGSDHDVETDGDSMGVGVVVEQPGDKSAEVDLETIVTGKSEDGNTITLRRSNTIFPSDFNNGSLYLEKSYDVGGEHTTDKGTTSKFGTGPLSISYIANTRGDTNKDNWAKATSKVNLKQKAVNGAPVVEVLGTNGEIVDSFMTMDALVNDPEGDSMTYSVKVTSSTGTPLSVGGIWTVIQFGTNVYKARSTNQLKIADLNGKLMELVYVHFTAEDSAKNETTVSEERALNRYTNRLTVQKKDGSKREYFLDHDIAQAMFSGVQNYTGLPTIVEANITNNPAELDQVMSSYSSLSSNQKRRLDLTNETDISELNNIVLSKDYVMAQLETK